MIYGELFAGIGGLGLGLERAGMVPAWFAEVDPFASAVLARRWPSVPNLGDVTAIKWEKVERVDLIAGGYPCQPFSTAGKRLGADDTRHLWPYFRDALRVLRPRFALMENVSGHVTLGLADVLADLAALGFDAEWSIVPASWVGAPHHRDRVFILAYPDDAGPGYGCTGEDGGTVARGGGTARDVADAALALRDGGADHAGSGARSILTGADIPESRNGRGPARPDGGWWASEPDVGRVAHGIPARVDRLRALGNAVVPQVAEWIGRRILEAAA